MPIRRYSLSLKAFAPHWPAIEALWSGLFHLDFTGSVARWTLTLVPLESKVKQSVAQVRIAGRARSIAESRDSFSPMATVR